MIYFKLLHAPWDNLIDQFVSIHVILWNADRLLAELAKNQ